MLRAVGRLVQTQSAFHLPARTGILPRPVSAPSPAALPNKPTRLRLVLLVLIAAGLLGGGLALWNRRAPLVVRAPARDLWVRNVRVIDVRTGTATAAADVHLQGGRIAQLQRHAPDRAAPQGAQVIEGEGLSLVPGLIDSHCHIGSSPTVPWDRGLPDPDLNLERLLFSGVTRVFDPGGMAPQTFELRAEVNAETRLGPIMHVAGPILTAVGGHPTAMLHEMLPGWMADLLAERMTRQLAHEADARRAVQELAGFKTDFIKIAIDRIPDGVPRLEPRIAKAVCEAATQHGLRTVAHVGDLQDAKDAAEAGIAAWVHGVYKERLSDDEVQMLAAFRIPMVPTLVVFKSYAELGRGDYSPTLMERQVAGPQLLEARVHRPDSYDLSQGLLEYTDMLGEQRQAALDNVRRLHAAGVTLLAGSDAQAGVIHGPSLHRELDLLSQAGLPPLAVLQAVTLHPAQFLAGDPDPDYGLIEVGKRADLILVRGDPLQDTQALHNIEQVILHGRRLVRRPLELKNP